jgi:3-oxoadipate enol-lactonase
VSLHHRFDGAGPVLVLSSSLGTTHEMWEPNVPGLADRFRVLRYDHPGHGRSPVGPRTLAGLARAVLELLDELALERVSFCGISLGGMVGMWLAVNAAERIDRLVLCCTAPRFAPSESWQERADTVRARGMEAVADTVLERWFTPEFPERERYRRTILATPPEGYARCCEAIRDADLRADLAKIEAPTLVVVGSDDPAVSARDTELLAGIRDAHVVQLQGRHLVPVERAAEFNAAVLA